MYAAWTASIIAGVTHGDGNDRVAYPVAAIGIVLWLCLAYRTFVRRG
jgi:membrane protease YdiL (CAAX protease family)